MNDKDVKDKAVFIVGFLAIFLTVASFKEELSRIYLAIGEHSYSVFHIFIFFISLLIISVYLFALDYLRYSFGRYQNFFIFRWIIPLANFFYSAAILFPILVLIFWIFGSEPIYGFTKQHENILHTFDVIGGILISIVAISNSIFITRKAKKEAAENMEKLRAAYLDRAIKLFNNKFYGEAIVEVYKVLEQALKEKLLKEKDFSTKYIPIKRLIELALKENILDEKSVSLIKDLQAIRNKGVHLSDPITKDDAEFFINAIRKILENEKFNHWNNE